MTKNKGGEPSVRNCTCKVRGNNLIFTSYSHSGTVRKWTGEHHTHATHDKQKGELHPWKTKGSKVVRGIEESGAFFWLRSRVGKRNEDVAFVI